MATLSLNGIPPSLPKRKPNRLKGFDYHSTGAYFITVCTDKRKNLFWSDVTAPADYGEKPPLSGSGRIVENAILKIPDHYPAISVDCYAVMPNHIHLLLRIDIADGQISTAPSISQVMRLFKGCVSKQLGFSPGKKTFMTILSEV